MDNIEESVGNRDLASMGPMFAKLTYDKKIEFVNAKRKMLLKSKHPAAKEALDDLAALEKDIKKTKVNESYISEANKFMYDETYITETHKSVEDSVKGILDKQYMIKKLDKIAVNKQHKTVEITFKDGYLKTVHMQPGFEAGWKRHFKEEGHELKMAEVFADDDMIVLDFANAI